MGLFLSRSVHKVDKKGRVSVPAGFRAALGDKLGEGLALYIPVADLGCIEAAPYAKIDERVAQIERLNPDEFEAIAIANAFLGNMTPAGFDGEGRIVLPPELIDYADISEKVTFVGMGRVFHIWEADRLAAHDLLSREVARKNTHLLRNPDAPHRPPAPESGA